MRKNIVVGLIALLCVVASTGTASGLPPVQRTQLGNGLVLLVSGEHSLPFITINLLVKAGSKDDPQGEEGLADLTATGLLLGAAGRTLLQINEELDFMGADMSSAATKDYSTVSLRVLNKDIERTFPILMDVLTKPTFPDDEVGKEITRTLGAIQASEDRPGVVAERAFHKALYMGGPYGHPVEGTKESVARLTTGMMKRFHQAYYHPNNAIMTIVGDVDERTLKGYIVPMLEKWPQRGVPAQGIQTRFAAGKETITINKPVTQSNVVIGNGGMSRDNPDYYAALVTNHIFGGGGLNSRLMEDIRNKRGLAYSVGSIFEGRKYPGSFQVFLQTKNGSAIEAIKAAREEMERLRSGPVSEKELEDAKKYLVGNFAQRFSTQSKIASFFAQVEYYGLGLDYPEKYPSLITAITREDVLRIARTYMHPDDAVTVIVADLKEAGLE
ncbi:MAG: pitrilysin family protein [Syntrophorhabdales bacterium]|jgi:zinc protease